MWTCGHEKSGQRKIVKQGDKSSGGETRQQHKGGDIEEHMVAVMITCCSSYMRKQEHDI